MLKEIKVSYKNEIKRFELPKTFKELKEIISKSYSLNKDFQITYLDDEQDCVIISNEFDLEQTVLFMEKQNCSLLRISIILIDPNDLDLKINFSQGSSLNLTPSPKIIKKNEPAIEMKSIHKLQIENLEPQITAISKLMDKNESEIIEKFKSLRLKFEKRIIKQEILEILSKVKCSKKKSQEQIISSIQNQYNQSKSESKENVEEFNSKKISDLIRKKRQDIVKKFSEKLMKKVKEKLFKSNNENSAIKEEEPVKKKIVKSKTVSIKKRDKEMREYIVQQNKDLKDYIIDLIDKKIEDFSRSLSNSEQKLKKEDKIIQNDVASVNHLSLKSLINETIIHPNTKCNGCSLTPIKGIRYGCSVCKDFNLCSVCEEKYGTSHKHNFIKFRTSESILNDPIVNPGKSCNILLEDKKILNSKLVSPTTIQVNEGCSEAKFEISIENNGFLEWPVPCILRNIQGVKGNKVSITQSVPSGKVYKLMLSVITSNLGFGEYNSKWQLFDEENPIGQAFDFKVNVIPRKKKHRFTNQLSKIRERYHLVGVSEEAILEALEKAEGNPDEAIIYLV